MHPAKATGRNKMPFGRDIRVVPSNAVLDTGPGPPQEGEIQGSEPYFWTEIIQSKTLIKTDNKCVKLDTKIMLCNVM